MENHERQRGRLDAYLPDLSGQGGGKMKKTVKAWAVFRPDGQIVFTAIFPDKRASIFMVTGGMMTESWKFLYHHGYRVRPITITCDDGRAK
jgi:hypothetical protein